MIILHDLSDCKKRFFLAQILKLQKLSQIEEECLLSKHDYMYIEHLYNILLYIHIYIYILCNQKHAMIELCEKRYTRQEKGH